MDEQADAPKRIGFHNRQNPGAQFDLLQLEKFFTYASPDHDPATLHWVRFYLLIFVDAGQGKHTIDFTEYPCEAGTILTVRKDQIQRFHRGGEMKGYVLLFTEEFLHSYLEKEEALLSVQSAHATLLFRLGLAIGWGSPAFR
ncbi:MAG: AraC family ligand binding domain-containing protein [Bacteroidota bacterium]